MRYEKLLIGLAACGCFSCERDLDIQVEQKHEISFAGTLARLTRGAEFNGDHKPDTFGITGYGGPADFMVAEKAGKVDGQNFWKTARRYYWPGYDLNFYAWAPVNVNGEVCVGHDTTLNKIKNFKMAQAAKNQQDLIVAVITGANETEGQDAVPLHFGHALSQVIVKMENKQPNSFEIKVAGVRIGNIKDMSTLKFPKDTTKEEWKPYEPVGDSLWGNRNTDTLKVSGESRADAGFCTHGGAMSCFLKATASSDTIELDNSIYKYLIQTEGESTSNVTKDSVFFVIPQDLTAWTKPEGKSDDQRKDTAHNTYIGILCRIWQLDGTTNKKRIKQLYPLPATSDGTGKEDKYGWAVVGIGTKWEAGKKYIYKLDFMGTNGGAGYIGPDAIVTGEDFGGIIDANPKNYSVTDGKKDGHTTGDPVIAGEIKFSVETISGWDDQPVSDPSVMGN